MTKLLSSVGFILCAAWAAPTQGQALVQLWARAPGSHPGLPTSTTTHRVLDYNPVTGHVLFCSRAVSASGVIYILDGLTGDDLGHMDMTGVSGGTLALNAIGVGDDGAIYGANVVTPISAANPLKLYRWANQNAVAEVIYSGDLGGLTAGRWGDMIAVRGAGPNTQILVGSDQAMVAIFTPSVAGIGPWTFTRLPITGGTAGFYRLGLTFLAGDEFYGKTSGNAMHRVSFDLGAGTAQFLNAIPTTVVPLIVGGMNYDPASQLLGGVTRSTAAATHTTYLWDAANPAVPDTRSTAILPTTNGDGGAAQASAAWGDGRLYVMVCNNGIVAYCITPFIRTHPQDTVVECTSNAVFTVVATGTPPLNYQWHRGGVPIPGATGPILVLPGVTCADDGALFSVTVTNDCGAVTSLVAVLTVRDTVPPTISCPPDQAVQATDPGGAVVYYPPPVVVDRCDPNPVVTCLPPSGSLFPVGVTTVTCTAKDRGGNIATCDFRVIVLPPKFFFREPLLPPTNGMYLSPSRWHAAYGNGILLSNVLHKRFTQGVWLPPPGGEITNSFDSEVQLELALGLAPGAPFQPYVAPASVTVRIRALPNVGFEEIYETEMLKLDIQGGTLPPQVRIRLNPHPPTPLLGETRILPVTGGYMISSFFDVLTEISLDGGLTWSPASRPMPLVLTHDPTTVPAADVPTALLPPLVHKYGTLPGDEVGFANGVVISGLRQAIFSSAVLPPPFGQGASHTFELQVDLVLQLGVGSPMHVRAPATATVGALHVKDFTDTQYLQTEVLTLDIAGGDLLPFVRLRESPTLPSQGGTSISGGGVVTDGVRAHSFFDIWLELSLDGGLSWLPATSGPVRVQLETIAPEAQFPTPDLPPLGSEYVSGKEWYASYAQGVLVSNLTHWRFTHSFPPPPPGGGAINTFDSEVVMDVSWNGGLSWQRLTAPAKVTVRIASLQDQDNTRYFDTEMLQLDIRGGDLPRSVMIRESPTRASTGRTSQRHLLTEQVAISSFFDVFTELSTDNGQTWQPSQTGPVTLVLRQRTCEPPVIVQHPQDTTVECTSNAVFTVVATGTPPLQYQWRANGVPLPSTIPHGPVLVYGPCTLADDGKRFDVVVWNDCGSVTSRVAVLRVVDRIPPWIECPPGMIVSTAPRECCTVVFYPLPQAEDACTTVTVKCDPPPGFCFPLGQNMVTCTATDESGNSSRCLFPITVIDTEPPEIICPPDMTVMAYAPTGGVVNYPAPTATDNCQVTNVTCVPPSGSVFPVGITKVTCTALDSSGNASSRAFRVTVQLIGTQVDWFPHSLAWVTVRSPVDGSEEVIRLLGPSEVEVYLDPRTGGCADLDGDGLDQAIDQMTRMELRGVSSLGSVIMRLRPMRPTWGEIEERTNTAPAILDLPPWVPAGLADSFLDLWPEIELTMGPVPTRFYTRQPIHLEAVLSYKPAAVGEAYTNTEPVEVVDALGNPTGYTISRLIYIPEPPCPPLLARLVPQEMGVGAYDVLVCWREERPDCRLQFTRDLNMPILWRDWTGPIQTLPDGTKCVRISNPQGQMYFRLCAGCRSGIE